MKFSYRKFPLAAPSAEFGSFLLRPVISVAVESGGRDVEYYALIDSGADFDIFHAEIGEAFGLNITEGEKIDFGGIQSRVGAKGYLHGVTLVIGGHPYDARVAFSWDIAEHGHGVLGQKGFFEHFIVKFDYQKQEVELKPRV